MGSSPFDVTRTLGPVVFASALANAVTQFVLVVRLRKTTPRPKNLYLIALAWPATTAFGIPDFAGLMGLGGPFGEVRTACVGITILCILQSAALLRDHLRSLRRADHLNAELASRVELLEAKQREVEMLNDDLRRQISARSRQLVDSFATSEPPPSVARLVLRAGDTVERRYKTVRHIGEGGMGAVYEVERIADGRRFAMKTLIGVADPVARARFAREAQIAANVKHPNIVSIVDFDVSKDGYLFLVMELVEGNTLHDVRKRSLDLPWTFNVLAQVAEGLDAIHAQGIIHRDLKPANILFSRGADGRRPRVKITDFGVSSMIAEEMQSKPSMRAAARISDRPVAAPPSSARGPGGGDSLSDHADDALQVLFTQEVEDSEEMSSGFTTGEGSLPKPVAKALALTRPGIVFGTPNYMAAELISGKSSKAADIFSIGVIAFELLTQKRPFRVCPLRAAIKKQELPPLPPLREMVPTLQDHLATVILRCLSHNPTERPTAKELAQIFREVSGIPPVAPSSRALM